MTANNPPWNQEAEAAVLGVILRGEASLNEIRGDLSPEDFYGSQHRAIYASIVELAKRGVAVDLVTTYDALRSVPGIRAVDAGNLAGLCEAAPVPSHLSHYVSIVKRDSGRRKCLEAVERFVASQHQPQSNGTEAAVEQLIQELGWIHQEERSDKPKWLTATGKIGTRTIFQSKKACMSLFYSFIALGPATQTAPDRFLESSDGNRCGFMGRFFSTMGGEKTGERVDDVRTSRGASEAGWNQFLTEFRAWCESEESVKLLQRLLV